MAKQPVSSSDNRLKQRLVGAIVLVSLAVIFIPMMLGGKGGFDQLITSSNIPAKPEEGRRVVEIPLHEVPPRPEKKPVTTVVVDKYTKELPENFIPAASEKDQKADVETKPLKQSAPLPHSNPESKPPVVAEKKSAKSSVAEKTQSWVVQMGSFSERANAMALRDRIRTRRYPAYVEAVATRKGTIYRVRVGPEHSRAKAEALQAKLRKVFNLNGIVFPHKGKR